MRVYTVIIVCALGLVILGVRQTRSDNSDMDSMAKPKYAEDGTLIRPEGYRSWVFVGSSLGLSYSENTRREGPGNFHNVYIQPEAYRHYKETGKFPEKTMLAMENFAPKTKESINQKGYFPGAMIGFEVALKDHDRFEEGWAYFNFSTRGDPPLRERAKAFPQAVCFACHAQHAADDNVFVQFYPVLREIMEARDGKAAESDEH